MANINIILRKYVNVLNEIGWRSEIFNKRIIHQVLNPSNSINLRTCNNSSNTVWEIDCM